MPFLPSYSPEFAERPGATVGADAFVDDAAEEASEAAVVPAAAVLPDVVPDVPSVCAVVPAVAAVPSVVPAAVPSDVPPSEPGVPDVPGVSDAPCDVAENALSVPSSAELEETGTVCVSAEVVPPLSCAQPDSIRAAAAAIETNLSFFVIDISFLRRTPLMYGAPQNFRHDHKSPMIIIAQNYKLINNYKNKMKKFRPNGKDVLKKDPIYDIIIVTNDMRQAGKDHKMKKRNRNILAALCAGAVLTGSACGGERAPAGGTAATAAATTELTTINTLDDDIENPVDISGFVDEDTNKLDDPNITYLGYYDIRTTGDIKPAVKLFEETYGGTVEYDQCAWSERIEKLQVLISSGQSPDLVDREAESFPMLASKNVYEDLTDYIDITQPQWDGYDQLIKQYEWNGKHFYYPWHVSALPTYIYYNGALFEEYGITTPRELYDKGEWDWNALRDTMQKFIDSRGNDNEVYGIYGLTMVHAFAASTGTPSVGIKDGKLVNNLSTPEIDRAAAFMEGLCRDGLTVAADGYWGDDVRPIVDGTACFLVSGQYSLTALMKKNDEVNVGFVPFPRDPSADKYYLGLDAFGYMVPKGADNIKGSAKFIDICRKSKIDPDLRQVVDESRMKKEKWTAEQIEFMKSFEDISKYDVVADLYGGLDSDTSTLIDGMLVDAAFHPDTEAWTVLRETNMNIINTAIDNINNG